MYRKGSSNPAGNYVSEPSRPIGDRDAVPEERQQGANLLAQTDVHKQAPAPIPELSRAGDAGHHARGVQCTSPGCDTRAARAGGV